MENQNVPATKQERLNIFFDECTIGLSDQPSYTKQDLYRFIKDKKNNNIRHFCQELLEEAKLVVEANQEVEDYISVPTEEEYIIGLIKQIANE